MSKQQIIMSCYSDLCKAATSFYLNPFGKTHLLFLKHALSLLKENNLSGVNKYTNRLNNLIDKANWSNKANDILPAKGGTDDVPLPRKAGRVNKTNSIYLADKIFTLGILLRNSRF